MFRKCQLNSVKPWLDIMYQDTVQTSDFPSIQQPVLQSSQPCFVNLRTDMFPSHTIQYLVICYNKANLIRHYQTFFFISQFANTIQGLRCGVCKEKKIFCIILQKLFYVVKRFSTDVTVTTDRNLKQKIAALVSGGILIISQKNCIPRIKLWYDLQIKN